MLDTALDGVNPSQPDQPNHMTEEAHLLGVRFQQECIAQGTVDLERQSWEARSGAYIEKIPLFWQTWGRKQGIKEKLDHHPLAVLQAGQVELPIPGPQLFQIDLE